MQWKKEKSIKFSNEVGDCLLAQMIKKKAQKSLSIQVYFLTRITVRQAKKLKH